MANPYEWSDDRERRQDYDRGEEDARRQAERYAEQDRSWDGERQRRQRGDYASGWYGEEAARQGYDVPGPYGRGSERDDQSRADDAANFDRYGEPERRRQERLALEGGAERMREGVERGWRRLSQNVRGAFDDNRPGANDPDPRRGGGMFGGQDRRDSLFSHEERLAGGAGAASSGPHRGKGPKGYVRADVRILEDVNDRLSDDGRLDASDIEVTVEAGEVTLNGRVASREDKRRAEDLAEQASGVKHVQNNLRVRAAEASSGREGAGGQNARATAPGTLGSTGGVPDPRLG